MSQHNLLKNSFVYIMGHVLARGLNFIIQITLWSNIFPPSDYGNIAYCFVFISFMSVILPLGLDAALMNYYVREKKRESYLSNTFVLIAVILLIALGIFLIFAKQIAPFAIHQNNMLLYYLSLAILAFDVLNNQALLILRAEGKALAYTGLSIAEILVRTAVLLILVLSLTRNISFALWANAASSAFLCIVLMIIILPKIKLELISKKIMHMLLLFGLPFFLSGIFERTIEMADRRLVGYYMGADAVGLYVACYTLGSLIRMLIIGFNAGWHPYFLSKIDEEKGQKEINRVYEIAGMLFIFIWFIASVWMPHIIRIPLGQGRAILNPAYWSGESIIPVIMGAYLLMGFYMLQMPGIYKRKRTGLIVVFLGAGALVNVVLNIVLIPRWGLLGAAWATAACYALMLLMIYFWNKKNYSIGQGSWKMLFSAAGTLALYFVCCKLPILISGKLIITISYTIVMIWLFPLRIQDILKKR